MRDAPIPDRLDQLLAGFFRPTPPPLGLTRRIVAAARRSEADLLRLEQTLAIQATSRGVCLIRGGRLEPPATAAARRLAEQAREEIHEYLRGRRAFFRVPVDLSTVPDFQRRVLAAASQIPFGEVRPYAWVAKRIGRPQAARAVGTALARNPVPLIVPCHRVWRSDSGVGGYLFGIDVKNGLLALERRTPVLEGCTTTRIVCRVGCVHGRRLRPGNRVVFASVKDARSVGYRPCKACKPAA
jgi:O-6-methylguanine DNA methyltransferase